jgi:hypothetical protein
MFITAGSDFSGDKVKRKRGSYAALKMKTPRSYSEVPCWKLVNNGTLTVGSLCINSIPVSILHR